MNKITTKMQIVGNKVETTIKLGNTVYHTNTASGAALERAINNSHAVKGLHNESQFIMINDDNAGCKVQYPIVKDKFLSLLAGYGVRHEASRIFG